MRLPSSKKRGAMTEEDDLRVERDALNEQLRRVVAGLPVEDQALPVEPARLDGLRRRLAALISRLPPLEQVKLEGDAIVAAREAQLERGEGSNPAPAPAPKNVGSKEPVEQET